MYIMIGTSAKNDAHRIEQVYGHADRKRPLFRSKAKPHHAPELKQDKR